MTSIRRPGILLLLSFLLSGAGAYARQTADTVVVGATAPSDPPADSSSLSGAGESTVSGLPDPVTLRIVPDTIVEAWKRDGRFAYANDPAYWGHQKRSTGKPNSFLLWLGRLLVSDGFRYFIYIVLGGLLVFAILRIMSENNLGLFYRKRVKKRTGDAGGQGEDGEAEEDLNERLQYYLTRNDHRRAVRYLYLRSLRSLGGRGLIQGNARTTNREYLRQLAGTPQEVPFRFLTGAYEKVWYGEFDLGDEAFRRLHAYFEDFDKTVAA
jgi:Domain of unknown function (DUF4129)